MAANTRQLDREQTNSESLLIVKAKGVESPSDQPAARADNTGGKERRILNGPGVVSFVYRRWILELLACLVALIALAAIVITLETHGGRPLPDWPYDISINALISVFSVILKGTMMVAVAESVSQLKWSWYRTPRPLSDLARFDLASRGIWGSARLLERLRGMHLASLGAAITILAIASDPFIQQVVQTYPCPQHSGNGAASLSRTNTYNQSGIHTGAGTSSLDLPMQAAIYEGVYNSFFPIQPTCTTGNCTFQDFRTAGICTACEDISSRINKTCNGDCSCVWQLRPGLNLTLPTSGIAMRMGPSNVTGPLSSSFPLTTDIMTLRGLNSNGNDCKSITPVAFECSLQPCVRTYSANVTRGQMSEKLLSTYPMTRPKEAGPFAGYSASPMPCLINGTYYDASSFTKKNSTNSVPVPDLLENNQTAYLPNDCYFTFPNPTGLQQYLPGFLTGYVMDAPTADSADPAWMGQLYDGGNATLATINATWAALADSMTVRIRQSPDGSGLPPVAGDAWRTDVCVAVRWPWLAYPAALLGLTIVFLLATIVQSAAHSRKRVWKGSPLALLFHGLDGDLRERFRVVDGTEEMERAAEGLAVKLDHERGELRFVEAFGGKA